MPKMATKKKSKSTDYWGKTEVATQKVQTSTPQVNSSVQVQPALYSSSGISGYPSGFYDVSQTAGMTFTRNTTPTTNSGMLIYIWWQIKVMYQTGNSSTQEIQIKIGNNVIFGAKVTPLTADGIVLENFGTIPNLRIEPGSTMEISVYEASAGAGRTQAYFGFSMVQV